MFNLQDMCRKYIPEWKRQNQFYNIVNMLIRIFYVFWQESGVLIGAIARVGEAIIFLTTGNI